MSKFQNFASQAAQPLKKAFHYLFAYDEDRLTLRGDSLAVNLAKLQLAFLKRQYLLVTLNDGSWQDHQADFTQPLRFLRCRQQDFLPA